MTGDQQTQLNTLAPEEKLLLAGLAEDLATYMLDMHVMSDPVEAAAVASSFLLQQYQRGWRFTYWVPEQVCTLCGEKAAGADAVGRLRCKRHGWNPEVAVNSQGKENADGGPEEG